MHLWTEYEGRMVAGEYTLGKLLRSEGRNGFFSTSTDKGSSAVIRLTEAHYDEEEQLKRWRQVADVHQDNLIEIERVGQTTFDGVALTYALMEPDDANLGDVLKERPLTVAEATQVAKSVAAALKALHTSGLVHEHVEPVNVLAVGETVKLRSDCVRECVADGEFTSPEDCAQLRQRDVHDFGTMLLQCLTLEKEFAPTVALPEPFKRLIPHAIDGSWGLDQIMTFLDPTGSLPQRTVSAAAAAATVIPAAGAVPVASPTPGAPAANRPLVPGGVRRPATTEAATADGGARSSEAGEEPSLSTRSRRYAATMAEPEPNRSSMNLIWAVCVVSALLIAWLGWHLLSGGSSKRATSAPATAVQPAAPAAVAPEPTVVVRQPAAPAARPRALTAAPAAHGAGWYVIAYTYNYEGQARAKAERVGAHHEGFHPEVFSPSGHAPYLVSLGGPMSEAEARNVQHRARRSGLPRDVFVRRY